MPVKNESAAYYDNYVSHQLKVAFNERHWFLFKRLQDEGITIDSNVLELGCGIGVNLYLLSTVVKQGQITGADLSPKSIEVAQQLFAGNPNASFKVADVCHYKHEGKPLDYILLLDVLEHIPAENRAALYKTLGEIASEHTTVIINIPCPLYHNEMIRNKEGLQLIEVPVPTSELAAGLEANGFYIDYMTTYDMWVNKEYQYFRIKKSSAYKRVDQTPVKSVSDSLRIRYFYKKIKTLLGN